MPRRIPYPAPAQPRAVHVRVRANCAVLCTCTALIRPLVTRREPDRTAPSLWWEVVEGRAESSNGRWAVESLVSVRRPSVRRGRQLEVTVRWAGVNPLFGSRWGDSVAAITDLTPAGFPEGAWGPGLPLALGA